jgi:hypothetical protein
MVLLLPTALVGSGSRSLSTPVMSTAVDTAAAAAKAKILQIAALTDRGQRLNKLVAPTYQEYRQDMAELVDQLSASSSWTASETALSGEWELIFSDVELFRSSPFFLAIEEALNSSPGIPKLGRWLGVTDPTKKAETFFKLHQLQVSRMITSNHLFSALEEAWGLELKGFSFQVLSWGTSTVGRIAQKLDFEKQTLESSFDTTIFGLTVIPILGWFKLVRARAFQFRGPSWYQHSNRPCT